MSKEQKIEESPGKQSNRIKRRALLSATGAGATIAMSIGFVTPASAESVNIRKLQDREPVRTILKTVGNPKILDYDVKMFSGSKTFTMRVVELRTQIGVLRYYHVLSSNLDKVAKGEEDATFSIHSIDDATKNDLPAKFSQIPLGVDVGAKYNEGSPIIVSTTTKKKQDQVVGYVGAQSAEVYRIWGGSNRFLVIEEGRNVYNVPVSSVSTSATSSNTVTTNQTVEPDYIIPHPNYCFDCGSSAGSCPQCAVSCVPGVSSVLECGLCIAEKCRQVDFGACGRCLLELISFGIIE